MSFFLTTLPLWGLKFFLKEQLLKCIQARAGTSMSRGSWGEGEWRVRQTRFLSSALTSPAWYSAMGFRERACSGHHKRPVPERERGGPNDL